MGAVSLAGPTRALFRLPRNAGGPEYSDHMTSLPSWTPTRVRELRILSAIREMSVGDAPSNVQLAVLAEQFTSEPDLGAATLSDHLKVLADEGAVALDLRLGGVVASVRLLPAAHADVEEFETARGSLPLRRAQLRDDYLRWLYDQIEVHDGSPTPDQYLKESPTFLGIAYTEKDLEKVGEWLVTNGFIEGQAAWQYAGPLRPTLRAKGIYTVENDRSTNDPAPGSVQTFNTTVHGPANIAQASTNVHQVQNIEWKTEGLRLLDAIEQAVLTVNADIVDELVEQLGIARAELASATDISKFRAALNGVAGFLGQTGAGALGGILTLQIAQFLATLP